MGNKENFQPRYTLEDIREKFRNLNLRYTMKSFRYCVENKLTLDDLRMFTPKNHLDLVMLATPDIKAEQAESIIMQWVDWGFTMPMLHALCLELAKESGFFTTEDDLAVMGEIAKQDRGFMNLILPTVLNTSEGMMSLLMSMVQQGLLAHQVENKSQEQKS